MNRNLKFLLASNVIFVFAGAILVPVYALFVKSINGGAIVSGILFGVGFLASSIAGLISTRLHDGVKFESHILQLNFFVRGLAWILIAVVPSIPTLFIGQIIVGITDGVGSPVFNASVSRYLDPKKHVREWGVWQFWAALMTAVGSIISGFIATYFGFQILFLIMAILAFVSLVVYRMGRKSKE